MEKLTFDEFKRIGSRYSTDCKLIQGFQGYLSNVSHGKLFAIFVQSLISFSSEKNLKTFLNKELPKLNKNILKDIFGWKKLDLKLLIGNLKGLLRDDYMKLSDLEMVFVLLVAWKLSTECFKKEISKNVVVFLDQTFFIDELKKKLALALIDVDYLEYFNPNDYKKELFEISMGI